MPFDGPAGVLMPVSDAGHAELQSDVDEPAIFFVNVRDPLKRWTLCRIWMFVLAGIRYTDWIRERVSRLDSRTLRAVNYWAFYSLAYQERLLAARIDGSMWLK